MHNVVEIIWDDPIEDIHSFWMKTIYGIVHELCTQVKTIWTVKHEWYVTRKISLDSTNSQTSKMREQMTPVKYMYMARNHDVMYYDITTA